jgi:seryl-tRNA synthetase
VPGNVAYDGRSFAPQLRGEKGKPREWIFVQLGRNWYVRGDGWKLNQAGELFDMKDSPFVEKLMPADAKDEAAVAARKRLQAVLNKLNPAGGKKISAEEETAELEKARKQAERQKQEQKQKQKQKKAARQAQL